jgi:threonine dehydrogenase-like Zn-dependent dehydrogenase
VRPEPVAIDDCAITLVDRWIRLASLIWSQKINPGKVFYMHLPLKQVAEAYGAMDERRAIKALLCP